MPHHRVCLGYHRAPDYVMGGMPGTSLPCSEGYPWLFCTGVTGVQEPSHTSQRKQMGGNATTVLELQMGKEAEKKASQPVPLALTHQIPQRVSLTRMGSAESEPG